LTTLIPWILNDEKKLSIGDETDAEDRDVWMRRELVNRQKEEQAEAEVDEKVDIDSIDSLICACGSSMLMRFSHAHDVPHAHDVLLCEREGIARVY